MLARVKFRWWLPGVQLAIAGVLFYWQGIEAFQNRFYDMPAPSRAYALRTAISLPAQIICMLSRYVGLYTQTLVNTGRRTVDAEDLLFFALCFALWYWVGTKLDHVVRGSTPRHILPEPLVVTFHTLQTLTFLAVLSYLAWAMLVERHNDRILLPAFIAVLWCCALIAYSTVQLKRRIGSGNS